VIEAFAPGRVNLIGDHTDYMGGLVLPMAIHLGTTLLGERGGDQVVLRSSARSEAAVVPIDITDPSAVEPRWARYVAGVVAEVRPTVGFTGEVTTTLPIGGGLSSSAALEVAVALALGARGGALEVARLCQRAEQRASGVPCGIMDQLASTAGTEGAALRIDCHTLEITPVPLPDGVDVIVVDSGQARELAGSAYAERRAECEAAEHLVGPLRSASLADVERIDDPMVRRRARHVVTECARVDAFAAAISAGDLASAGRLMVESHESLRDDFEVSTSVLDDLVAQLNERDDVHGARMTGAGFGGCVVVLAEPGSPVDGWRVRAAAGARLR
jgi:galactokinase